MGLIPGTGRSLGEENSNPLQYSCLGNSMDRKSWQATVHSVTKESDTISDYNNNNILYLMSNLGLKKTLFLKF